MTRKKMITAHSTPNIKSAFAQSCDPAAGEATELELCTSVLELLQWKEDIQDEAQLLPPLTQLLQQLLDLPAQKTSESQGQDVAPIAMDISDEGEEASGEEDEYPAIDSAASR